ncbi:MAG: ATP-dependent helicase [Desulfovibrionaceae bacterium]|nr:ATP-dependent helicase [Desulfovibrionaceae bacterium]
MSFHELNAEQQAAVLADEKRVLVLAGAGSGKTRTLVERVAHLVENGVSGYEIVCTTFTRAAAGEMRARLEARIGREARKVTVSTFHGLGLGLLKRYGQHIGLRYGNLTVYTPLETEILLQHCGEMLGMYKNGKWAKPGKRELNAFMAAVERGEDETLKDSPFAPLRTAFESACRQNNALPYYGLIHGLAQLAEAGKVREFTNWTYFLVDEVQDLDRMQWRALDAMLEHTEGSELYAVGDISQSIYGFRGAVPEHLQHLIGTGALSVYELRSNYRSVPAIVEAANSLIRHNTSHHVLEMQAMRETEDILHCLAKLGEANSAVLANMIAGWRGATPPVVLCRNNRMLDKLSEELAARNVPYKRIGKRTTALHSPLFVKAHAALKCFVNPFDETAFLLAHEGLGVDAAEYAQIRVAAAEQGKSGFEVFRENLPVERLETMPSEGDATANALEWFASGGYRFDPADGESQSFLDWLGVYVSQHPLDTIADYLDWLALVDVQDELPAGEEEPGILLMTCHASKGLEFPCVIIAGCNEGVLPGKQALTAEKKGDTAAIEDERRLMYVAVTRARDTLILAVRPEKDDECPSRFLAELGM